MTATTFVRPRPRVYFDATAGAWAYQLPGCAPIAAASWAQAWDDVRAAVLDQAAAQHEAQEDFLSDPPAGAPLEASSAGNLPAVLPVRRVGWWRRWRLV